MIKIKYFEFVITLIIALSFSCDTEPGYIPDEGPKNIKFTPTSGKPGDIITITGEDFMPIEDMNMYISKRQEFISLYGSLPLILFNVNIYYTKEIDYSQLHIEGTGASEYVDFDENRIVCKIPEGAKTGKIWVNGRYAADFMELHHPSEEEFVVYDASGDIVR